MITCPHCYCELEAFEAYLVAGLIGCRFVVDCDECEKPFDIDVTVRDLNA